MHATALDNNDYSKRTLLFGTGDSARKLLQNSPEKRTFIAAVDNDREKQGHVFQGMPIISPSQISDYQYDEILIASYWEGTIKKQLIDELNISKTKIVTPKKKYFKSQHDVLYPFKHRPTLQLAYRVIKILCGRACKKGIPLHLDYGTLLGIMRDQDLILWDDDIDLAARAEFADKVEQHIIDEFQSIESKVNWTLRKDIDSQNNVVQYYLTFKPKHEKQFKPFAISIALKGIVGDKAIKLNSLGAWFTPSYHLDNLDKHVWQETEVFIPQDFNAYLAFNYGDWKSPKKDLSIGEGENWQEVSVEAVKKANITKHWVFDQNDQ